MDSTPSGDDWNEEMGESSEDKVVTMMDVLKEQQEFEEDANAVLGASDDKNCTYSKGYVKRQALYSCLTCCNHPEKKAAICLACSLHCHENHELIELYTKRNFRCDCGNSKFDTKCQFNPDKSDLNDENKYNQNFSGIYCTCHRPYPDPEVEDDGDMIQCIICEDWLHANHLEATVPPNNQYAEMICKGCMSDNLFLHDYTRYAVGAAENGYVEEKTDADDSLKTVEDDKPAEEGAEAANNDENGVTQEGDAPETNGTEEAACSADAAEVQTSKVDEKCTKPRSGKTVFEGATFWPADLRQKLCSCAKCVEMYKDLGVLYLIDQEDTVTAYETLGKENLEATSQYEQGMQALSSLDRVQQINAVTEYNNMRDKLVEYLKSFKDKKEVVTEEDVRAFFAGLKPRKLPDGVYFCR